MRGKLWVLFAGLVLVTGLAFADAPAKTAREAWEQAGSPPVVPGPLVPGTPGTLWDNGANDGVNGLATERNTAVSGTGGPEGDHGATVADDFDLPEGGSIDEVRVCLWTAATTLAEMYIYADVGGAPGPTPIAGAPTTADFTTTTYTDSTTRCAGGYGWTGREFRFVLNGSVVLPPGTYWLVVVGDGQGNQTDRDFWATSGLPLTLTEGVFGSTFFAVPYWTPVSGIGFTSPEFAFDIDGTAGQQTTVLEIPTLGQAGFALLAILLGGAAFVALRRSRKTV